MPNSNTLTTDAIARLQGADLRLAPVTFFTAVTVLLFLAACDHQRPAVHMVGTTMGTQYSIKVIDPGDIEPAALKTQIDVLLAGINRIMSTHDPDSELSRLNQNAATDWISVSDQLYTVLAAAITIGRASNGAFDVTIGPLVNLWGFGPNPGARIGSIKAIFPKVEKYQHH